jgi:hypothetical protein
MLPECREVRQMLNVQKLQYNQLAAFNADPFKLFSRCKISLQLVTVLSISINSLDLRSSLIWIRNNYGT